MSPMSLIGQMSPMSPMGQMGPMSQIGLIGQIGQMGPMSPLSLIGQMSPRDQVYAHRGFLENGRDHSSQASGRVGDSPGVGRPLALPRS